MTLLETTNPAAAGGRGEPWISFDTDPGRYRHWKLAIDGPVATLALDTAEASASSGQLYLAAVNGAASGGGYELALATEHILLVDDGSSAVSLPEVPLLGVLP